MPAECLLAAWGVSTLIDAALRRTVEERIQALEEFERFREELRAATERQRDALR
jgi:hypothetical protein